MKAEAAQTQRSFCSAFWTERGRSPSAAADTCQNGIEFSDASSHRGVLRAGTARAPGRSKIPWRRSVTGDGTDTAPLQPMMPPRRGWGIFGLDFYKDVAPTALGNFDAN
jgi:hypothetical protein